MPQQDTPPNFLGLVFKPWPLLDLCTSIMAMGMLFLVVHLLEKFTQTTIVSYSAILAGGMASMVQSYLHYCGYSLFRSPTKIRLTLLAIYFVVLFTCYAIASSMIGT